MQESTWKSPESYFFVFVTYWQSMARFRKNDFFKWTQLWSFQFFFYYRKNSLHFILYTFSHIIRGIPAMKPTIIHQRVAITENIIIWIIKEAMDILDKMELAPIHSFENSPKYILHKGDGLFFLKCSYINTFYHLKWIYS